MKRKKTGLGKGSCVGGKRSFSAEGRANKRARKIAKNIARDQAKQMNAVHESIGLEKSLASAVDWSKSGISISQRKKLKQYRKAHKLQALTSQHEADTAASADGASLVTSTNTTANTTTNTTNTTVSLWQGDFPDHDEQPPLELKLLRKSLGIRVTGRSCPSPIEHINDTRLPSASFSSLWKFNTPTPIQRQMWPAALCGLDCMAIAPTGSGKTLAYVLPTVAHIRRAKGATTTQQDTRSGDGRASAPRCMICVPTRELASQVVEVCTKRLRLIKKVSIRTIALVGGQGTKEAQVDELLRGPNIDIVVGTCGRLLDLIDLGALSMVRVTILILDEADMMLNMGFEDQLSRLFELAPPRRQTILVSATFPQILRTTLSRWTRGSMNTTTIRIGSITATKVMTTADVQKNSQSGVTASENSTVASSSSSSSSSLSSSLSTSSSSSTFLAASPTIIQTIQILDETTNTNLHNIKIAQLNQFLQRVRNHDKSRGARHKSRILLFANTRDTVNTLFEYLKKTMYNTTNTKGTKSTKLNFGVAMLHGQLDQNIRAQALSDFRAGKSSILITTDVAARGLDVEKLPFVYNFDMPTSIEMYIHRIGRTGRQGNVGVAETLFSLKYDMKLVKQLRNVLQSCNQSIPEKLVAM